MRATAGVGLLVTVLSAGSTGCAAQSCSESYQNPIVHVDATAWAGVGQLPAAALTSATICVAASCAKATPISPANPDDLSISVELPAGTPTVRVKLTSSDGRMLDQTMKQATVTVIKPFGSGCGGLEEINLTVTQTGSLVPGRPAKLNL